MNELGGFPDPPDLPEGHHDGLGHLHISLAWLAFKQAGFKYQAGNKAILGSPEKKLMKTD